jgi:hypothetical protein
MNQILNNKLAVPSNVIDDLEKQFPDKLPREGTSNINYLVGQQSVIDYLRRVNSELEE